MKNEKQSIICTDCGCHSHYIVKEAKRNILANSFKRFEDIQILRHTKPLGIVQIDESVWKKLSQEEKAEIEKTCDEKLESYCRRLVK